MMLPAFAGSAVAQESLKTGPAEAPASATSDATVSPPPEAPIIPAAPSTPTPPAGKSENAGFGESWAERTFGVPVHGYLSTRYRYRSTDGARDQDLYESLNLTIGDPDRQRVTVHFLGRASADLDGRRDIRGFYVFDSLADTYRNPIHGQIYDAYIDVHRIPLLDTARIGRQIIDETPVTAWFDGGRFETRESDGVAVKSGVYGGVPVHPFETSREGDRMAGAFFQIKPWKGAKGRVDWMYVTDDTHLFGRERNDLEGYSFWQGFGETLRLHTRYTRLENLSRDILVDGTFLRPDWDFRLQASFYEQIVTLRDFAVEFDPFFASLFDLHPYYQTRVSASKGIGEHAIVDAGVDLRRMINLAERGPFNRDYDRYHLTPSVHDWPVPGLSVSVTGEIWNGVGSDIATAGADITYEWLRKFRASAGTTYTLYRYDYYLDQERDDVRTWYANFRYRVRDDLRLDLGYELERDSLGTFHVVKAGVTWSF